MRIISVADISMPELDVFARLREPQLYHYYEPTPGLFLAEGERVAIRAINAGYEPVTVLAEDKGIEGRFRETLEACGDIPIYSAPYEIIKELTGYSLTGGFLCAMRRQPIKTVADVCRSASRIAVLERITNPTNIGAIVRSAAALSVDAILFTKDSCDPLCRRSIRVSMGTIFQIPWTVIEDEWPDQGMSILKQLGYETIALALTDDAEQLGNEKRPYSEMTALIFGAEGNGLSSLTIEQCDRVVRIPMRGGVDSLNVAAASAVAFWEIGQIRFS